MGPRAWRLARFEGFVTHRFFETTKQRLLVPGAFGVRVGAPVVPLGALGSPGRRKNKPHREGLPE